MPIRYAESQRLREIYPRLFIALTRFARRRGYLGLVVLIKGRFPKEMKRPTKNMTKLLGV